MIPRSEFEPLVSYRKLKCTYLRKASILLLSIETYKKLFESFPKLKNLIDYKNINKGRTFISVSLHLIISQGYYLVYLLTPISLFIFFVFLLKFAI